MQIEPFHTTHPVSGFFFGTNQGGPGGKPPGPSPEDEFRGLPPEQEKTPSDSSEAPAPPAPTQ
jgi:hypothetical protein